MENLCLNEAKCDRFDDYSADDWLNSYTLKVSMMDPIQRAEESRRDYRDDSQTYTDYLDYVEEWEWFNKEQTTELTQTYIQSLAKRHGKINCNCDKKEHIFTDFKNPLLGDVIIDLPGQLIYTRCWFKFITKIINKVLTEMRNKEVKLPTPVEHLLCRIAQWKLAEQGVTPYLLPYDIYLNAWWDKGQKQQTKLAKNIIMQLNVEDAKALEQERLRHISVIKEENRKVLLHFPHGDHGLHYLKIVLSEAHFSEVWGFMNMWRRKLQSNSSISVQELNKRMSSCQKCQNIKYKNGLSPLAIYYAPPGVGKSTALENMDFVGFDTDWIGVGPTWIDYSPILKLRIPIITNQHTAFVGCGLKILGVYKDTQYIRTDILGKPFTTSRAIEKLKDKYPQDMILRKINKHEYFTHYLPELEIMAILQKKIANYSLNILPFYKNEQDPEWVKLYPKLLRKQDE